MLKLKMMKLKMTGVVCYDKAATLSLVEKQVRKKAEGRIPLPFFFFKLDKSLLQVSLWSTAQ